MRKIITSIIFATVAAIQASATLSQSELQLLSKYVDGENVPKGINIPTFVDNDEKYLQMTPDGKKVNKYDTKTGNLEETVFDVTHTRENTLEKIDGFTLSPEGSKLLVWESSEAIYRHSFSAKYYVYEFRSRLLKKLSDERERQQAPLFSPDGRMVAYVADNNIYLKKLDYGTDIAVTTDGKKNEVINGVPDWTYQEEFSTTVSMSWAPDNLMLCFLKYNEKNVPMYSFPLYEGACPQMPEYKYYPGEFTYKYPVAGENNSKVSIHSYNIETRKTLELTLPDNRIEYIPRIMYGPVPEQLMAVGLNRDQNRMEIYSVNPKSNVAKSLMVEESKTWIAPESYEKISLQKDFFVVASSRTGYQHYYKYSYAGASMGAVTSGNYDVTDYYGYSETTGRHFYQAAKTAPTNRTVYNIDRKGVITALSPEDGYASAIFSKNMSCYIINYSNINKAPEYSLNAVNAKKPLRILEQNKEYISRYSGSPKTELFTFDANGIKFYGKMVKPVDFNPAKKYPVIMNQYSGPGSQEVLNRWSMGWENAFALNGYIVITVDGRGTGGRGRDFMDVVYMRLGHFESIDQNTAARYAASLPYVDSEKIGIYGWSYGGYETIMAASMPDAPYAAAVAVAPVTDWRFYDTVYAERYMRTPAQNESGYNESAAATHSDNLKCPLLIIHGTADDNVHFYNSLHYITELEKNNKWCDLLPVPNANHSIRGCGRRSVVYGRMLEYFRKNM